MENRNTERPNNPARVTNQPPNDTDEARDETQDTLGVENESDLRLGGDTGFDRVIGPEEAGLGGGLDQAEEARLGVTDEQLAEIARGRRKPNS